MFNKVIQNVGQLKIEPQIAPSKCQLSFFFFLRYNARPNMHQSSPDQLCNYHLTTKLTNIRESKGEIKAMQVDELYFPDLATNF